MIDMIKPILDVIAKGLYNPDLEKIKKEKKLGEIGVEVFSIYTSISRIIYTGTKIISNYEKYIYAYEEPDNDNRIAKLKYIISDSAILCKEQIGNIQEITRRIYSLSNHLDILT